MKVKPSYLGINNIYKCYTERTLFHLTLYYAGVYDGTVSGCSLRVTEGLMNKFAAS